MEKYDNEALVKRIQSGDAEAQNELLERNEGLIRTVAGKLLAKAEDCCLSKEDNEDLLLEGRLALLTAAFGYDEKQGTAFNTYGWQIVRNKMVDYMRKSITRAKRSIPLEQTISMDTVSIEYRPLDPYRSTPLQVVLAEELHESLKRAVNDLPERQKEYVSYRFGFEDDKEHSVKEVASEFNLGVSEARKLGKKTLKSIADQVL